MMKRRYDVIVVGTGVAGLIFALSLPEEKEVLVISKGKFEESDSYLAQGGICTLRDENDFQEYYEDTMKAGHGQNDPEAVRIMIENSTAMMQRLMQYGVKFDCEPDGTLRYTKEGAHRSPRILHVKDQTGKAITEVLLQRAMEKKNLHFYEYHTMIDIIEDKGECRGIVVEDQDGNRQAVYADAVGLGTGGLGGLFSHSTNYTHITGDSFAIALEHGISLENINYIQIHPTTLYTEKKGRSTLISEAVRGEGAILLNENGERFTDELQPRDVVAKAIIEEMKRFNKPHVYLTLVSKTTEEAKERFPYIFEKCQEQGLDMTKDRVPVVPAQHYIMGGIKANTYCETDMPRLYALGETACNGVHGRNRLASNSLLEGLVFAERAAEKAAKWGPIDSEPTVDVTAYPQKEVREQLFRDRIWEEIKRKDPDFYDKWS